MRTSLTCIAIIAMTSTNVTAQIPFETLKHKVQEDTDGGFMRFLDTHINICMSKHLYFVLGGASDDIGEDFVLGTLYNVAQLRKVYRDHWALPALNSVLIEVEEDVRKEIRKQVASGAKLSKAASLEFCVRERNKIKDRLTIYAKNHGLTPIEDPEPAPAYPVRVKFTNSRNALTVKILPLSKFRIAEAYGEEIVPAVYAIGTTHPHEIQSGSYIYYYGKIDSKNRPLKVQLYHDGIYPLE